MAHRYFAYGSNVNIPHVRDFLASHGVDPSLLKNPRHTILRNHCIRTNYLSVIHCEGAATIEDVRGDFVEGVVMDVASEALDVLRIKEGWPARYHEVDVTVEIAATDAAIKAFTYVVNSHLLRVTDLPVTPQYRSLVLDGARANGFSRNYVKRLERLLQTVAMLRGQTT